MANDKIGDIENEFLGAELGDSRRAQRLLLLAKSMANKPEVSFPSALPPSELEAACRFFGSSAGSSEAIIAPDVRQTLKRAASQDVTLIAHDSSVISFKSETGRDGLVGEAGLKQRFLAHCSLAIRADGSHRPEGVVALSYHRPVKTKNAALQHRWSAHIEETHSLGMSPKAVVHLMDREADDYDVLQLLLRLGTRFVVRVQHNRRLAQGKLRDVLEQEASGQASRAVRLSRRGGKQGSKQRRIHPPRDERMAALLVASSSVKITKDPRRPSEGTLKLNVVRVWEPEPPEDEKGIEWLLYTSEPVDTPEQMFQVVDWYRAHWCIEEYFKALKQACGMEKRQLGDLHALANAMALLAPIAWKILLLKSEARARPDEPATKLLDKDELEVLVAASGIPLARDCTTEKALLAIASLGGHLKHNGSPGWLVLHRGYRELATLLMGWQLRRSIETAQPAEEYDQ